jgi:hypothetical protein
LIVYSRLRIQPDRRANPVPASSDEALVEEAVDTVIRRHRAARRRRHGGAPERLEDEHQAERDGE